jgi:hypothetical protein
MDLASLQSLLSSVAGARVACVGDVMLDRFVYGEVTRTSPEAPIPVLARTREIAITGVANHSPTDAVALDATRILVLNRRFDLAGQGAALSLVDLAPAFKDAAAAPLPAQLLARWQAPVALDNMEGLAIRREGARVFAYIVSDDNFSSLQRTLLMKFELKL